MIVISASEHGAEHSPREQAMPLQPGTPSELRELTHLLGYWGLGSTFTGAGPHPRRQESSHPHQAVVDHARDRLLVPDLGADSSVVATFRLWWGLSSL